MQFIMYTRSRQKYYIHNIKRLPECNYGNLRRGPKTEWGSASKAYVDIE